MGSGRPGTSPLNGVVRVVPDVPSFAVDDGFAYSVPAGLDLPLGSLVRVPLGGRTVRGWVVSTAEPVRDGLRTVLGRSGDLPVFGADLLGVLRWAAMHYVAPLSALLAKATPPNLPRGGPAGDPVRGRRSRARLVVGPGPWHDEIATAAAPVLASGSSVLVVAATVAEAGSLALGLGQRLGVEASAVSSQSGGSAITAEWVRAATVPGSLILGTREVAAWPLAAPGLAVVAGEGRRGMKDRATPTVHARDLLQRRAVVERFGLLLTDHVPTPEAVVRSEVTITGRPWGLVDLVDRRRDPPGSGLVGPAVAAALRASGGRRVLVFTHRREAAQRCVRCRALRRCPSCGAAPGDAIACIRCGAATADCPSCGGRRFEMLGAPVPRLLAEVSRIVGRDRVGLVGSGKPFVVGTERDLPGLQVDLTVVVDGDGPLLAPSYRAAEDGLRLLARAVAAAGPGRGRRGLVQTSNPEHPALAALQAGDPVPFVRADAVARSRLGFPPGGEVLAIEAAGPIVPGELAEAVGDRAAVHGPAPAGTGWRWLVQAVDLGPARLAVRGVVGRWRESGARVRVDADPMDL